MLRAIVVAAWGCSIADRTVNERAKLGSPTPDGDAGSLVSRAGSTTTAGATATPTGGRGGYGGTPIEAISGHESSAGQPPVGASAGAPSTLMPGCAERERSGVLDGDNLPHIAACRGAWQGDIGDAGSLCATGWHVCRGNEPAFSELTFTDVTAFAGCYAYDAANDFSVCHPDCSAQIGSVDVAGLLDMAGMGADCNAAYYFAGEPSCLTQGGRVDASENDGVGCGYDARFSGVVCCED